MSNGVPDVELADPEARAPGGAIVAADGERPAKRACPAPPPQPDLPDFDAEATIANVGHECALPSMTAQLDAFIAASIAGEPRADTMLHYLQQLPNSQQNSQMLAAELSYICFAGEECPLIFDAASDVWYVYKGHWQTSKNSSSLVRVYFQSQLLAAVREVKRAALTRGVWPATKGRNDEDTSRDAFLKKLIERGA